MNYEVKVQDRVVGTVEGSGRSWYAVSVYDAHLYPTSLRVKTRTEAERYLVNRDTAQNSR